MSGRKRPLPIGQQSLPDMVDGGFIYIDKTDLIYNLIKEKRYFFLSRPRRFGKTLLVSTLQELFSGNRKLFSSLSISSTPYAWQEHPVIVISFASMASDSAEALKRDIAWTLSNIAKHYGVTIEDAPSLSTKFKSLILKLAVKNKVVVLVDEYDYTILQNIENLELAQECRTILRDLFSALKDVEVDKQIRFIFITGVTKFSKTSIFSGLNNLQDLTLDHRAAQLLGYTVQEIRRYYEEYLSALSEKTGESIQKIMEQIRFWYNGYQFTDPSSIEDTKVYNPFSVMLYLESGKFLNYWFETGTPTYIMRLIKTQRYAISAIEGSEVNIEETKSYEVDKIKLIPLLWQAGYLTIESYNPHTQNYRLMFPNEEVKVAFLRFFMSYLTETQVAQLTTALYALSQALKKLDFKVFFETLRVFFAQIPYTIQLPIEKYYQSIFFIIMKLIGADVEGEVFTNDGRIDATIVTDDAVLVFEFKLNDTAQAAIDQIEGKKYYQKYMHHKKKIVLVGVQFDTEKRTIGQWLTKDLE